MAAKKKIGIKIPSINEINKKYGDMIVTASETKESACFFNFAIVSSCPGKFIKETSDLAHLLLLIFSSLKNSTFSSKADSGK